MSFFVFGQAPFENDIRMLAKSSEITEIKDLLMLEGINYYQADFIGAGLTGKDYSIIVKEVWNGEIKTADTLINTAKNNWIPSLSSDSLSFRIIAKKYKEDQIKMLLRLPSLSIEKKFDATLSESYSLRSLGDKMEIRSDENFYAFAYILPYEENGVLKYCEVDGSGKDVESWGTVFNIPHYLIFEMRFSSPQ